MIDEIIAKAKRTNGLLTPTETLILAAVADCTIDMLSALPEETHDRLLSCLNPPTKSTSPESKPEPTET